MKEDQMSVERTYFVREAPYNIINASQVLSYEPCMQTNNPGDQILFSTYSQIMCSKLHLRFNQVTEPLYVRVHVPNENTGLSTVLYQVRPQPIYENGSWSYYSRDTFALNVAQSGYVYLKIEPTASVENYELYFSINDLNSNYNDSKFNTYEVKVYYKQTTFGVKKYFDAFIERCKDLITINLSIYYFVLFVGVLGILVMILFAIIRMFTKMHKKIIEYKKERQDDWRER